MKQKISKLEFKNRVIEEAKATQAQLKREGTNWSLAICKREVAKVLVHEFEIA